MASNTITNYKKCASTGCTNPSNGRFAFCDACYKIRLSPTRICHSCKLNHILLHESERRMTCNMKKYYCSHCTSSYTQEMYKRRQEEYKRREEEEYKRRQEERLKEQMKREEEQMKRDEKKRVEDERMRQRIDNVMCTPLRIRDMLFELYTEIDVLTDELKVQKEIVKKNALEKQMYDNRIHVLSERNKSLNDELAQKKCHLNDELAQKNKSLASENTELKGLIYDLKKQLDSKM